MAKKQESARRARQTVWLPRTERRGGIFGGQSFLNHRRGLNLLPGRQGQPLMLTVFPAALCFSKVSGAAFAAGAWPQAARRCLAPKAALSCKTAPSLSGGFFAFFLPLLLSFAMEKPSSKVLTEADLELIRPLLSQKIRGIDWVLHEKSQGMDDQKRAALVARLGRLKKLFRQLYGKPPKSAAEPPEAGRRKD